MVEEQHHLLIPYLELAAHGELMLVGVQEAEDLVLEVLDLLKAEIMEVQEDLDLDLMMFGQTQHQQEDLAYTQAEAAEEVHPPLMPEEMPPLRQRPQMQLQVVEAALPQPAAAEQQFNMAAVVVDLLPMAYLVEYLQIMRVD